jgi:hypothetical protein
MSVNQPLSVSDHQNSQHWDKTKKIFVHEENLNLVQVFCSLRTIEYITSEEKEGFLMSDPLRDDAR